jgi:hypothetical protein
MALYRKWTSERGMHASWMDVATISPLAILTMAATPIQSATSQQGTTRRAK